MLSPSQYHRGRAGAGVYILSLNFIIAQKRAERILKIVIFAPIAYNFCTISWIIFENIGQILIKSYLKCQNY